MTILSRVLRAFAPLATLAVLVPSAANAQSGCTIQPQAEDEGPQYAKPDDPWIYRGTDIPIDKDWLLGELPNGVRYAVRKNGVPPCQISLRVAIDAGSLHEEDSERGFAHLLEHMTFRESRDFGPGEAIPYFQRLGASLGADTNATTSPTQTVYQLNLPNANHTSLADSVRLFSGMIQAPVINQSNLDMDLPIVLAERRDSVGAAQRISDTMRGVMFAGQRLAVRSPIGTLETLQGATGQSVQAFHDRWYRPENTLVVIVGDADPKLLAALVEREFGDWQGKGEFVSAPAFGDPIAPAGSDRQNGVPLGEVEVIVEANQPRQLTFATLRPWTQVVDTLEYNRGGLLETVALQIINRRLERRARSGGSFLYAQVQRDKISRSVDGTYVSFAPLSEDWQGALADVRGVIADALAYPPSQAEIDQEVAEFDIGFVNMVEQARIQPGSGLANTLVGAVDIRESVAAPATFLNVFRSLGPRLTPEEMLSRTRKVFEGDVIRGVYLTPQAGEATPQALRDALAVSIAASSDARSNEQSISFADLPAIGEPAAKFIRQPMALPSSERVIFPNGVRAILYPVDNEPGRVTVRVRFGAGYQGFAEDEGVYAMLGEAALVNSGLGDLDQNALDTLAAGRKFGFGFGIEEGTFSFRASTREEDLEDQLYLLAAKLAMPRWDEAPIERVKASAQLSYSTYGTSASGVINRDLEWLLTNRDGRFATPNPEAIAAATPEKFREVWERLLAQGMIEVDVFGDIDANRTIASLAKTFGALPTREPVSAEIRARSISFPVADGETLNLTHSGDGNQAAAVIAWPTGGGSQDITESRKLGLLARVFANRLIDNLRERNGAAYSPVVISNWPLDITTGGKFFALVQVEPSVVPSFFEEAEATALDLATNGPTDDELERVLEPAKQLILRAQTGHTFWLSQLEGGAFDVRREMALAGVWQDIAGTTSEEMRVLADRYLYGREGFRLTVMPENPSSIPTGR